ncbi:MAG TPA: oxidoreductase [Pseudonocardiaceae bacterium]|jgi:NAD(P)-dependent dehydrogenase (short-subunit alcohol dehydrogenase family)
MPSTVALVTGASSGIGKATATALHELGHTVYAAARRVERMRDLEAAGVRLLPMDVTDDESMTSGIKQIIEETGRLDILVNNAGYGSYGALEDVSLDEARRQFDVNVFGLARLTQLALPHMRAQRSGHIVNVSSIGGKIYEPLGDWYHATKFAVEGLSDSLRVEVKPFGIKVVVIEPGAIKTEWSSIAAGSVLATSGETAYAGQAKTIAAMLNSTESNPRRSSPPTVISKAIVRAVTARRPKTRYVVGLGAKPILFARRVLPDRTFDALITGFTRFAGK